MSIHRARVVATLLAFVALISGWMAAVAPAASAEPGCHDLVPLIKDDRTSPAQWVDPGSLSFALDDAARTELPEPLGPIPAGPAYLIGASQVPGVPWLGVNTMNPDLLAHTAGDVTWELTGFDGPGEMYVFTQGNMGQVVGSEWFSAAHGSPSGSTVVARNSHVHPNWVFSTAGTYHVELTQTATLTSGDSVSGTATLTFEVGTGAGSATEGHFDFGSTIGCAGHAADGQDAGDAADSAASDSTQGALGAGPSGNTRVADESQATSQPGGAKNRAAAPNAGTNSAQASPAPGSHGKSLPNTGASELSFPIAFLGLGVLILGGGLVFAARHYRLY